MDRFEAQQLVIDYATAVAYVEVTDPGGSIGLGTCFHVGDGVFVTARHVLENHEVSEIRVTEPVAISLREFAPGLADEKVEWQNTAFKERFGFEPQYKKWLDPLTISGGPYFHSDPSADVAVFKVGGLHQATSVIKLGVHFDDWIYRGEWRLSEVVILGYPPIPLTPEPYLVAVRADINTFVQLRGTPFVHFIVSATARGGFSGSPAIHEGGFALGVVTSSLVRDGLGAELGFQAVLSVEPIRLLLDESGLMPPIQKQYFDDYLGLHSGDV